MRSIRVGLVFALCTHCASHKLAGPEPERDPSTDPAVEAAPSRTEPAATGNPESMPDEPRACNATDPRATAVKVWALPDADETPFVEHIESAKRSVRVFAYMMGYGGILDALEAKARAGIDVRVIMDGATQLGVNDKYRTRLEAAGAKVEWSDPAFTYMHAKSIVVDDRVALVSTSNYSLSFLRKERNYVARVEETQDVADIVRIFEADWSHGAVDLSCTRLVVSPVNSSARLVALIASAKRTVLIESMQFSERSVRDAVYARKAAGVDVRVILASPSWIDANAAAGAGLAAHGIPVRWLGTPSVHVKSIVVDGEHAYLGSENLSYTSLAKNREIGLVLSDASALSLMDRTFTSDWTLATPFDMTDPGAP